VEGVRAVDYRDVLTVLQDQGYQPIITDAEATAICRMFGVPRNTANDAGKGELLLHVAERLAKFLG
jgi:hypothetical protein